MCGRNWPKMTVPVARGRWAWTLSRILRTGALARCVRDLAVTGLTSNPTILGHAMAAGSDYDSSLARLVAGGVTDAQDLV
jgi:transaldolase